MTEEEQKAIGRLKEAQDSYLKDELDNAIKIALKLIQKQQAELEKKDKIIKQMVGKLVDTYVAGEICKEQEECDDPNDDAKCKECVTQYFVREAEKLNPKKLKKLERKVEE